MSTPTSAQPTKRCRVFGGNFSFCVDTTHQAWPLMLSREDVVGGDGAGLVGHEEVAQCGGVQRSGAQPVDLAAVIDALLQSVGLRLARLLFLGRALRRLLLVPVVLLPGGFALLAS